MTKQSITKTILKFALPLMLGDLFQQLYIAADSAIVGRFAGDAALGAVGGTTFLIRMVIGVFIGISAGASVVISQSYGAGNLTKASRTIHTMCGLTLLGGLLISIFGIVITEPLLRMVSTPAEIMVEAKVYLQIYFVGALFQLIYNVGSGIMRAYGDSKTPFYYLMFSSVSNIFLDYILVAILSMGIAGAATATVLSQLLSSVLLVRRMILTDKEYQLQVKEISIDKTLVSEILRMGIPAGVQGAIVSLSNVIVQMNINNLGSDVIAGFGVFNKFDGIIMLPASSVALACMTFTGQNYGAGKMKRVIRGIFSMVFIEMAIWVIGALFCLRWGNQVFYIFTNNDQIVEFSRLTMRYMIPFYWSLGISYALTCIIRGMGKSQTASLISIGNMCIARQIWIVYANHKNRGFQGIVYSYPVSWMLTLVCALLFLVYFYKKGEFHEN